MTNWIFTRIVIHINPPSQSNRITLDISPGCRIIIPEEVVMQPRFLIVILTR